MASQHQNNPIDDNSEQTPGQAQARREEILNKLSEIGNQNQNNNFLQETGTQVKNIAQGAAGVGKGAAQGAVNLARGAADAVKSTLGIKNNNNNNNHPTTTNVPGSNTPLEGRTNASNTSAEM